MKDNTDIKILVMCVAAFVISTLGIVVSPTMMSQIFFAVIDLFIAILIMFLLGEIRKP